MFFQGELRNLIVVITSTVSSIFYCHKIGKIIPKGIKRLSAIFPIIIIFLFLPLNLQILHFRGPTSFFLSWLATFKLLLFAFGQGPLSTIPPLSFPRFISLACFPIKIQQKKEDPSPHLTDKRINHRSPINYVSKILLVATFLPIYENKEHVHPKFLMFLYSIHLYIALEFLVAVFAAVTRACISVELEPQFDEPYLATSLQDFWGRRWNLMVSSILRPTVYNPIKSVSSFVIGEKWASIPAILVVFWVSGVMHEIIFYHMGRKKPTGELTCFFLLHGVCLVVEVVAKKAMKGRWRPLPRMVSRLFVVTFVVVSALWLFMPQLLYSEVDTQARREIITFVNFVRNLFHVE